MQFKRCLVVLLMLNTSVTATTHKDVLSATWRGEYYHAIPNRPGISKAYCRLHSPGVFIHTVNDALNHPIVTNKGIVLSQPKFQETNENGLFLIRGSFLARGKIDHNRWEDHIDYYLYKLTPLGMTRGVWSTKECKGLYVGKLVQPR